MECLKDLKKLTGSLKEIARKMDQFENNYKLLKTMEDDSLEKANLIRAINLCESWKEELEEMEEAIETLNKPFITGELTKNERGRYEMDCDEFTCGRPIAALVGEEKGYIPEWEFGRVEHNGDDYYFLSNRGRKFDLAPGMKVAIRDRS